MVEHPAIAEAAQAMPITVRIRDACRLSGIGRSKLYELIAAGEIEIIKVGTITLVPMASLTRFLDRGSG
jgi:excisionase family DNA binding protein